METKSQNRTRAATPQEQLKEIKRGAAEIIPEDELLKKFENSYQTGKPLVVKFGADPSRPDIHLGHTVALNKLKMLQDFGHEVNFLIGDFTARIGDPTGRSKVRQQLTEEEVRENAKTYKEQVFKILDPEKTKIVFNSTWLEKIHLSQFLQILMNSTLVQLLAREDFTARHKAEQPIYMHEFLYPILQGYDSVAMKADIELGGTDQKFNLLMGRHLQSVNNQPPQALLILPLLEGLDGVQKMSKTYGNVIALTDSAKDIFGKIMSISDTLMYRYYDLLSFLSTDQIKELKEQIVVGDLHPMQAKKQLAEELVDRYHGAGKGREERLRFEEFFSKRTLTGDLPVVEASLNAEGKLSLIDVIEKQGFAKTRSEARRLLQQRAVKLNGEAVTEEWIQPNTSGAGSAGTGTSPELVLKVGKLHVVKLNLK